MGGSGRIIEFTYSPFLLRDLTQILRVSVVNLYMFYQSP